MPRHFQLWVVGVWNYAYSEFDILSIVSARSNTTLRIPQWSSMLIVSLRWEISSTGKALEMINHKTWTGPIFTKVFREHLVRKVKTSVLPVVSKVIGLTFHFENRCWEWSDNISSVPPQNTLHIRSKIKFCHSDLFSVSDSRINICSHLLLLRVSRSYIRERNLRFVWFRTVL